MADENTEVEGTESTEYYYPDFTNVDEDGRLKDSEQVFGENKPEKPEAQALDGEVPEPGKPEEKIIDENNANPNEGENPFSLDSFESPEKAMEFYTKGISNSEVKLPIDEPKPIVEQKEFPAPKPTFAESAMNNINSVVSVMEQAYKTYGDWDTAKQYATQQYEQIIAREQQKQEMADFKAGIEKENSALQEQKKVVAAKPAFWENITDITQKNGWGKSESLQAAMFDPKIGGWFMHWMFQSQNPDAKYNSTEEHKAAWEDWIYKFGADKANLEKAEKITRLSLMANNTTQYSKTLVGKELKKKADFNKGVSKKSSTNKSIKTNTQTNGLKPLGGWLQR